MPHNFSGYDHIAELLGKDRLLSYNRLSNQTLFRDRISKNQFCAYNSEGRDDDCQESISGRSLHRLDQSQQIFKYNCHFLI